MFSEMLAPYWIITMWMLFAATLNLLNRLFLLFNFTPECIFFIVKFKRGVNLIPVLLVDDFGITKYPGFDFLPTEIK